MNRTGRTIGAAVGAVVFMIFFAELAERLIVHGPTSVYAVSSR